MRAKGARIKKRPRSAEPGGIAYRTSYRRKQRFGVFVLRVIINLLHGSLLHDLSAVHDEHAVSDLVDDV